MAERGYGGSRRGSSWVSGGAVRQDGEAVLLGDRSSSQGRVFGREVESQAMRLISVQHISFMEPDVISVDASLPESVRGELSAMSHNVRVNDGLGNAHGLTVEHHTQGKPV